MLYTRDEFLNIEEKSGVYVFVYDDACPLCKIHVQSLYNNGFGNFDVVMLENDSDLDWLFDRYNIEGIPHTVVYKNNEKKWDKNNVFFKKQIRELTEVMRIYE